MPDASNLATYAAGAGAVASALVVALIYVFKANERLHDKLELLNKEWQAKYDAATERHAAKAENWAEKGFTQGEKLTEVLDRIKPRGGR